MIILSWQSLALANGNTNPNGQVLKSQRGDIRLGWQWGLILKETRAGTMQGGGVKTERWRDPERKVYSLRTLFALKFPLFAGMIVGCWSPSLNQSCQSRAVCKRWQNRVEKLRTGAAYGQNFLWSQIDRNIWPGGKPRLKVWKDAISCPAEGVI